MQWREQPTAQLREAKAIIDRTADYLRRYGWCQGNIGAHGQRRCLIGGFASAVGQHNGLSKAFWKRMGENAPGTMMSVLLEVVGSKRYLTVVDEVQYGKSPEGLLAMWNDDIADKPDDVFELLAAGSELLVEELTNRAMSVPESERPLAHVR